MKSSELEIFYEDLARALDAAAVDKRELLLAKLALLLARDLGDLAKAQAHVVAASENLDA